MKELSTGITPGWRYPITGITGRCCAHAASGHAVADPTIPLMKSRRLMPSPQPAQLGGELDDYSKEMRAVKGVQCRCLRSNSFEPHTPAQGHEEKNSR